MNVIENVMFCVCLLFVCVVGCIVYGDVDDGGMFVVIYGVEFVVNATAFVFV